MTSHSESGSAMQLTEFEQPFLLWLGVVLTLLVLFVISLAFIFTMISCQVGYRKRHRTHVYTTDAKQTVQRLNSVYSVKSQENILKSTESLHSNTPRISLHSDDTGSNHNAEPTQTVPSNETYQEEGDHLYEQVDSSSTPTPRIQSSNGHSMEEMVSQNDTMTTTATDFEQSQLAEVNLAAFPVSPSELTSPLPQENTPSSRPHFTFEDGTLMPDYPATIDPEIRGEDVGVGLNIERPPTIYSSQILQTVPSDKQIELQYIASGPSHGIELDIDDFADEYIIEPELSVPIVVIQTPTATSDDRDRFIMLSPGQVPPPERIGQNPLISDAEAATCDSMKNNSESFINCDSGNVNDQDKQQPHDPEAMYDRLPAWSDLTQQGAGNDEDNLYDQPIFSKNKSKVEDPSTLFDDPGYSKGIAKTKSATLDPALLFDDPGYTRGMMLANDEETTDHKPRERSMTLDLQTGGGVHHQQPKRGSRARKQLREKVAKSASYENVPPGGLKRKPTKQKARVDLREEIDEEEIPGEVKLKQNLSVQGATTIPFLKGSIRSLDLLDYQQQELEDLDPDIAACLKDDFDSSNEFEINQV